MDHLAELEKQFPQLATHSDHATKPQETKEDVIRFANEEIDRIRKRGDHKNPQITKYTDLIRSLGGTVRER